MHSENDNPKLIKLRKEVSLLRSQMINLQRESNDLTDKIRHTEHDIQKYTLDIQKFFNTDYISQFDPLGLPFYDSNDPHTCSYYYKNGVAEAYLVSNSYHNSGGSSDDDDWWERRREEEEEEERRRREEDEEERQRSWDEFDRYLEDGYWS